MRVTEIFYSIQGEVSGIGEPTIFVRLQGCNLKCEWCDSKYSWVSPYQVLTVQDVINQIKEYKCKNIVITGGEPLLQQDELISLLGHLYDYQITIETNGTIKPCFALLDRVDRWNISPKLGFINYNTLKHIIEELCERDNYIFKIVVQDQNDVKQIRDLLYILNIPKHKVYLMPCASNRSAYIDESRFVVEQCKEHGFNFSPREHIVIWGDKRGV